MAAVYIETIRNLPLLLQIIFWAIILRSLPGPSHSLKMGVIFLKQSGFICTSSDLRRCSVCVNRSFGSLDIAYLWRWAKKRHDQLAQFPNILAFHWSACFTPKSVIYCTGGPISWEVTELARLVCVAVNIIPSSSPWVGPCDLHWRLHRRNRSVWYSSC